MSDQSPAAGDYFGRTLPSPLRYAVLLMYVGTAFQVSVGIFFFSFVGSLRTDPRVINTYRDHVAARGGDAQQMIDSAVSSWRLAAVGVSIALTALWLTMAWAARTGKNWARPTATAIGLVGIFGSVYTLLGGFEFVAVITLVLSAAILVLMYRPESAAYFESVRLARS
ncbi:MAG: hypothetical protein WAW85_01430 [Gordonia sp. (in: high G+C Gram-positive bacteria)]|uniref:hypothetical protein n=1 Tax=Gordonia sp. (in: high G+C Gram-positive bacteria) TaxID=84139 RepID=UPI003BB64358